MRNSLVIGALLAFAAGGAAAQGQVPPAQEGPQNPAISTSGSQSAAGPVKGANSFTEGEAKSRIEDRGFANVTGLNKDEDGIWRGRAMRDGTMVEVALDYQGNVFHGAAAQGGIGTTGINGQDSMGQRDAGQGNMGRDNADQTGAGR